MNNKMHVFAWIGLGIAAGVMLLVIYWMLFPFQTVVLEDFKTTATNYHVGDTVTYTTEVYKYLNKPAHVYRQLQNRVTYVVDSYESNLPEGITLSSNQFDIPSGIEMGTYKLVINAEIKVNPVRTITKTFKSNDFTVTK